MAENQKIREIGEPKNLPYILVEEEQICLATLMHAKQPMSIRAIYRNMIKQTFLKNKMKGINIPSYENIMADFDLKKDKEIVAIVKEYRAKDGFSFPSYELIRNVIERLAHMPIKFNWTEPQTETTESNILSMGNKKHITYEKNEKIIDELILNREFGEEKKGKKILVYYANPKLYDLQGLTVEGFPHYITQKKIVSNEMSRKSKEVGKLNG